MEKLLYFGDGDLRQEIDRMDQLTELRLKFGAAQYIECLRKEVVTSNLYMAEAMTERQQEPKTENSRRIIHKIQAELLKKILPVDRDSHMAVRWMKTIRENHLKMATVQMELMTKMRQHDGDFSEESGCKLEDKNQFDIIQKNSCERNEEKKLELVTNEKGAQLIKKIEVDLLRTILPMERTARMAVKYMKIIRESRTKLLTIQEELLEKLKERKAECMLESLRELENVVQTKWNTILDEWDNEKRYQKLFTIFVGQVRRIRTRRCPQMAGKIMKKLQDRQLIVQKLHEELMKIVHKNENARQRKEMVHKDLMKELERREEMKERRKRLQMEITNYYLERAVEDTHFVPRRLFLNGVEAFKSVPKSEIEARVENREIEQPIIGLSQVDKTQPQLKRGANPKPTLKNRLKRFFGFQ